jgi:hypothetical protein
MNKIYTKLKNLEKIETYPQLIKSVIDSGDVEELNNLVEQFKKCIRTVKGLFSVEQVSLYETYEKHFSKQKMTEEVNEYLKFLESEYPERMKDSPQLMESIVWDYVCELESINGFKFGESGDEPQIELTYYVEDRLINEKWEDEEDEPESSE